MIAQSLGITTYCVLTKDPYEPSALKNPNPYPIQRKLKNLIGSAKFLQINAVLSCCREKFKLFEKPEVQKLETAPIVNLPVEMKITNNVYKLDSQLTIHFSCPAYELTDITMQTTNKLMHTIVSTEAKNQLMVPACFNEVNFG